MIKDFLSVEEDVLPVDEQEHEVESPENTDGPGEEFDVIPDEGLAPEDKQKVFDSTADKIDDIDNAAVPNDKVFDGVIEDNQIPAVNNEFIVVESLVEQLAQAVKYKVDIKDKGLVSVEQMQLVEALLPGTITEENPIGLYTSFESATNVDIALEEIDNSINQNYDDMRTSLRDILEAWLNTQPGKLKESFSALVAGMSSLNKAYAMLLVAWDKASIDGIPFYLNNGDRLGKFIDRYIISESYPTSAQASTVADPFVKAVTEVTKNITLNNFITTLMETKGKYFVVNDYRYNIGQDAEGNWTLSRFHMKDEGYTSYYASYRDLLSALTTPMGVNAFKALKTAVQAAENSIRESVDLLEAIQTSEDPIEVKVKNLMDCSARVSENTQFVDTIASILTGLHSFYQVYTALFTELAAKNMPQQ